MDGGGGGERVRCEIKRDRDGGYSERKERRTFPLFLGIFASGTSLAGRKRCVVCVVWGITEEGKKRKNDEGEFGAFVVARGEKQDGGFALLCRWGLALAALSKHAFTGKDHVARL